ncbi:hypothetical protein L1049_006788 [Liquidambar formosana]|uniref:Axial regulator YABBY 4 n=1 Tax=Liquidambar formosana TaxID=63359 RepID=A0AAP0RG19_LIQFO
MSAIFSLLVVKVMIFGMQEANLMVSVPCSSLSMVVMVRCGDCTSLLSVNMMKTSFVPLHLFASLSQDELKEEVCPDEVDAQKALAKQSPSMVVSSDTEDEEITPVNHVINEPPEKRQRAPSTYNCFINKEEIRRLKNENPNMTHKEAFGAVAKHWALFAAMQDKEVRESKERTSEKHSDATSSYIEVCCWTVPKNSKSPLEVLENCCE